MSIRRSTPEVRDRAARLLTGALMLVALAACSTGAPADEDADAVPADVLFTNARFVTLDEAVPEAEALAVRDGRVLAVGEADALAAHVGPATEVVDLGGAFAIPGFIEGHGHFLGIGDAEQQLALLGTTSWQQIVDMVGEAVARAAPGQLIRGRGWHQEKWDRAPEHELDGLPLHDGLSAVSPDHPVVLRHASGHASFANAKAMEMAGIDFESRTPDPPGGEIVRDRQGRPTGMFRETAQGLLDAAAAGAAAPDLATLARAADREVLANGITSFQDAGTSFAGAAALRELAEAGELDCRLWVMIRDGANMTAENMAAARVVGAADERFTVRAIKYSIDGALGPHGAWLLEPYTDLPTSTGLNTVPVETIEATSRLCVDYDFQLCVHAIGDRANRETLDLFERAFAGLVGVPGGSAALRWRVEHAQHLHPDDIPRFAEMGVIASMQGVHCTSDGPWVEPRLGEQRAREGAYVWRALLDSGAVVTNGTDAPVEDVDPIASYFATVTRQMADGTRFYPDQRMSRLEALRSYTLSNAYAAFEEDVKGSLTPGKLADITVLSQDILGCPEDAILDTRVLHTIVGGEVVYSDEALVDG